MKKITSILIIALLVLISTLVTYGESDSEPTKFVANEEQLDAEELIEMQVADNEPNAVPNKEDVINSYQINLPDGVRYVRVFNTASRSDLGCNFDKDCELKIYISPGYPHPELSHGFYKDLAKTGEGLDSAFIETIDGFVRIKPGHPDFDELAKAYNKEVEVLKRNVKKIIEAKFLFNFVSKDTDGAQIERTVYFDGNGGDYYFSFKTSPDIEHPTECRISSLEHFGRSYKSNNCDGTLRLVLDHINSEIYILNPGEPHTTAFKEYAQLMKDALEETDKKVEPEIFQALEGIISSDTVKPTVAYNTQEEQWFKKIPTLDIDFSDNVGLDDISYQFDGTNGNWQPIIMDTNEDSYTNDWSIDSDIWNNLMDGEHYIYFKVTDKAENEYITLNNDEAFTIKKDATPPSGGSISYSDGYYTTRNIILNLNSGADSGSGVNMETDEIQKQSAILSNGICTSWSEWYSLIAEPTPLFADIDIENSRCYRYRYSVLDNVGNERIYDSESIVKIDTIAPTVEQAEIYLGKTYFDGTNYWYTGTTSIRASAVDEESGIIKCEYTTDGFSWNPATYDGTYCKKENIGAFANWLISFRATNGAGLTSTGKERLYTYDPNSPITSITGKSKRKSYKFGELTKNPVEITLSCKDGKFTEGSGCSKIKYCTHKTNTCNPSIEYSSPFTISGKGTVYVRFASEDNLGNREYVKSRIIRIK